MLKRICTFTVLCLSWIAAAALGAGLALRHALLSSNTATFRALNIVDQNGATRLRLGTTGGEPFLDMNAASGKDALHFDVQTSGIPHLQVFDPEGKSAVEIFGFRGPQGLLTFSSDRRPEGKLMVGHFGISDDGTDLGAWGLQVTGQYAHDQENHLFGVVTHNGLDQSFIWPVSTMQHVRRKIE